MTVFRYEILKIYLRSKLTDENLQGLAMAFFHKVIRSDTEKVINHFALKNRGLYLSYS